MNAKLRRRVFGFLCVVMCLCTTSSFANDLRGIWKLMSSQDQPVLRYKVFDKQGNYYNLNVSKTDVDSEEKKPLSPANVTRWGCYHIAMKGIYVEKLMGDGQPIFISYKKKGNSMVLTFKLGSQVYREAYQKVLFIGK